MDSTLNSTQKNFRYLSNLIANAKGELTLDFDVTIDEGETEEFANGIPIDVEESLVINAADHTIDAKNMARIFNLKNGNVVLKNFNFKNGHAGQGGAIYTNPNTTLKIDDSTFSENTSDEGDSQDISNHATLILNKCELSNTTQSEDGTKSILNTHMLYLPMDDSKTVLKTKSDGGQIIFLRPLKKHDKNFTEFYKEVYGEKEKKRHLNPFYKSERPVVDIKYDVKLDILNDEHLKFPSGFPINMDDLIIDGHGYTIDARAFSRIFTVTADNVKISNLTLRNGFAKYGGAIKNRGNGIHIESVTFKDNEALESGGAIYNEMDASIEMERVFFIDNIAHSKLSGGGGGAIYNYSGSKIDLDWVRFTNNSTAGQGEAIYNDGDFHILNSVFVRNVPKEDAPSMYNHKFAHLYIENSNLVAEGEKIIVNRGLLRLFNNEFSMGTITNHDPALLKLYKNEPLENAHKSVEQNNLRFINNGNMNVYNIENKPGTVHTDPKYPDREFIRASDFGDETVPFKIIENTGKLDFFKRNEDAEVSWIEVNLFVSSTTEDMYAERNYLESGMYADLKSWCMERRIILNVIDLKGGIADDVYASSLNEYLDSENSFHLCFIGQRQEWISNRKLATDQTLLPMLRILDSPSRQDYAKRSLFLFRENPFDGAKLSEAQRSRYINRDLHALKNLRTSLEGEGFMTVDYKCDWIGDETLPGLKSLEEDGGKLGNFMCDIKFLKSEILSIIKVKIEDAFPIQKRSAAGDSYLDDAKRHNIITKSRSRNLIGRKRDLRELDLVLINDDHKIFMVRGGEGIGKSTLLCRWCENKRAEVGKNHKAIIRLCGATPKTATFKDLYLSIGSEAGIFNGDDESMVNAKCSFDRQYFERLKEKGVDILIISNVDKLGEFFIDGPEGDKIPEDFWLILSSESNYEINEEFESHDLRGFESKEERMHLINKYLASYLKDVSEEDKAAIISHIDSKEPLYMRILLNGLRLSGSLVNLDEMLVSFGADNKSAFEHLIEIFENDPAYDSQLVKSALCLLACARDGLGRDDLSKYSDGDKATKNEMLSAFLSNFDEYLFMKDERYLLRYEELRDVILDRYSESVDSARDNLVKIYKKAMKECADNLEYSEIQGSGELLYQLEKLGSHEGILEVLGKDEFFDKISPDRYGLHYKHGTQYSDVAEKLGFAIGWDAKAIELFRQVSQILLDKALAIYRDGEERYPKDRPKLARMYEEQDLPEFIRYRDSFFEPPEYYRASVYYALRSFAYDNDSAAVRTFVDEHNEKSSEMIPLFEMMEKSGDRDLGLDEAVKQKAASALKAKRQMDAYHLNNL